MRVCVILIGTPLLIGALRTPSEAQTRTQADSANPLRRCAVAREPEESADRYAIRCAERFVVEQGYANTPPAADTNRVVPEGIEWTPSRVEWVARRRGTIDPRAAGLCTGLEGTDFTVVFRRAHGNGARGVTLDAAFGSLRVQHQEFRFEVIEREQYGCRPIAPAKAQ